MKLKGLSEEKIIKSFLQFVPCLKDVPVPVGDDCAIVPFEKKKHQLSVYKTDCILEGIHFLRNQPPEKIGWKALCRVLSDFAAMAAKPRHVLITIAAPPDCRLEMLRGIYRGIGKAARKYDVVIAGGETARSKSGIFLSIAAMGTVRKKRFVTRSGGKSGDVLFVTGRLGGSSRGRHLTFLPRLEAARWLAKHFKIHAMMDLSDGLAEDLPRLADASSKGFHVDLKNIPRTPESTLQNALCEGEDYELLFAVSPRNAKALIKKWKPAFPSLPLTQIGILKANKKDRTPLGTGFQHF